MTKITRHNSDALRPDPSAAHTLIKEYDLQELWGKPSTLLLMNFEKN